MKEEWRKYLKRNVPRYTSYPSALHFTDDVGPDEFGAGLDAVAQYEPVSVYVHIPYCKELCWYCGCNMRVERRYERTQEYVTALIDEIALVAERLGGRGRTSQVHFGGGTPNFLENEDLRRIIDAVEMNFGLTDNCPIAMELDPRLCNPTRIRELVRMGVSRMSLGVQDFDLDVQKAINRVQPFEMIDCCVSAMREAGVSDVSFDLLYGLPNQKLSSFTDTLEKTILLNPDRISLFGYAHLPSRIPHQKMINDADLPDAELRIALAEFADQKLVMAGYERIGFDHFAKADTSIAQASYEGRLNRNFQGFTEDPAETVIGLGVSAISSIHGGSFQNTKNVPAYCAAISDRTFAIERGIRPTYSDQAIGHWIRGLLCHQRASLKQYFDDVCTANVPEADILSGLMELIEDDVVSLVGDELVIREEARPLSRVVASIFDPSLGKTRTMSQAV